MNSPQKPVARQQGLVIQEMPDEILVFDLETNKAHCLNQTAAFVWRSCDGTKSVSEIVRLLGSESGKPVEEDLVWLAIDQLNENNLLAQNVKADFKNQTRREIIKKVGLAAVVALPLVSSLVAPTAALAAGCSSAVNGTNCGTNSTCCGGVCCSGITSGAGCPTTPAPGNPCNSARGTGKTGTISIKQDKSEK